MSKGVTGLKHAYQKDCCVMRRQEAVRLSQRSNGRAGVNFANNGGGGKSTSGSGSGGGGSTLTIDDSQRLKRRSLNRPENSSRLACYYALFLTLSGLVLTICVVQHSGSSSFSEATEWTQVIFFLAVLTGAIMFLLWLMGHVMRLPPQSVPQRQIREFRGRANSISVHAVAPPPVCVGRRISEDIHVYDNFRDPKYTVPEVSPEVEELGDLDSNSESNGGSNATTIGDTQGVGNAAYMMDEVPAAVAAVTAAALTESAAATAAPPSRVEEPPAQPQPSPPSEAKTAQPQSKERRLRLLSKSQPPPPPAAAKSPGAPGQHRMHRLNTITINSALDLHITEIPPYTVLTQGEAHSPSFFLRIAAVVFGCVGIVNMLVKAIDACLTLASAANQALQVFSVLRCLVNMTFNAVQTFFLFKYSKISIAFRQRACLFGLMHLLATNLCLWIGDLGEEKMHKYGKLGKSGSGGNHSESYQLSLLLSPYLYPFNIEYSLMAAFFCHALFRNVGAFISLLEGRGLHMEHKSMSVRNRTKTKFSVSCHKSTKGLLSGVGLVLAVVCCAAYVLNFEALSRHPPEQTRVEKRLIQSCVMLSLQAILLAMVAPVTAALRRLPRQRRVEHHVPCGPGSGGGGGGGACADKLMLQLGLSAVVVSELYVLLDVAALTDSTWLHRAWLGVRVCEALASIVQSSVQVLALDLGLERNFSTPPGTELPIGQGLVTALIPANLAVWIFYTLTGPVTSSAQSDTGRVISAICLPVVIFFRFHSVGCFAELWKLLQRASDEREAPQLPGPTTGSAPGASRC